MSELMIELINVKLTDFTKLSTRDFLVTIRNFCPRPNTGRSSNNLSISSIPALRIEKTIKSSKEKEKLTF